MIEAARESFQIQYKQCEVDLGTALDDVKDQIASFLDFIPGLDDSQLERLLEGETVEVEINGVKDHIVIPGT
jgi:hypothetical protein